MYNESKKKKEKGHQDFFLHLHCVFIYFFNYEGHKPTTP